MRQSMLTIKYRHHRHDEEEPPHRTEDKEDYDITGEDHKFLKYRASESIEVSRSEKQDDRTVWIFPIVGSYHFESIF